MSSENFVDVIRNELAKILDREPDSIDADENLLQMGVSSIEAIKLINQIKKVIEVDINPMAIFEYKTITEFANYVFEQQECA